MSTPLPPGARENHIILAAIDDELGPYFDDLPYKLMGVGKVNAAYTAARAILDINRPKPKLVINFGTCGSPDLPAGTLVQCVQFVQGDMNCEPLGYQAGITPFESVPYRLDVPARVPGMKKARCITRDQFVNQVYEPEPGIAEVVDMEAYAIAKVCFYEKIPFICVKAVSDPLNSNSWECRKGDFGAKFREVYDRLFPPAT
jgi:adenosylhomocysteine nucleosidase